MAPTKPPSQEQTPGPSKQRTIGGRVTKSSPNNATIPSSSHNNDQSSSPTSHPSTAKMPKIPKGHDRYGACSRKHCGGYKIRKMNNPRGSGPHAGKWSFVCSNRLGNPPCGFYQVLEFDPLEEVKERYLRMEQEKERQQQFEEEERELQVQLQAEQDQQDNRAPSPMLSSSRMAICPRCQRGHLVEKKTDVLSYTEKYLECSRRRARDGTVCDYQSLIINTAFYANYNGNSSNAAGADATSTATAEPEDDIKWDALSYIAAVPAPVTKKPEALVDLTAESDDEDRPLITGTKRVSNEQPSQGSQTKKTSTLTTNSRVPRLATGAKGANRGRQVVNLVQDVGNDDDYEKVEGLRANVSNSRNKRKRTVSKKDEYEDLDSDIDDELIEIVDRVSRPSAGGRRL
ncbi:hypothetical protein QBC43DRAFT_336774 [Cladorrhinum sp. PSN259]|nr:hypothetical protein QBC43DRAFT_336774 [Cladorrhinum sp. PSN259]